MLRFLFSLFIAASTLWGCIPLDQYSALREAYNKLDAERQTSKQALQAAQNNAAKLSAELQRLQQEIQDLQARLQQANQQVAELSAQLAVTKKALADKYAEEPAKPAKEPKRPPKGKKP